jgi:hypothetical protein
VVDRFEEKEESARSTLGAVDESLACDLKEEIK